MRRRSDWKKMRFFFRPGLALKKLLSAGVILCALVSGSLLPGFSAWPVHAETITEEPSRAIYVVYDDSGSMYNDGNDAWSKAKYSMEVFAAMLSDKDTMNVYYMSDYEKGTGAPARLQLSGSDGPKANVAKIHNEKTAPQNTQFFSVEQAMSDLEKTKADEKWLVILTDGEFQKNTSMARMSSEEVSQVLYKKPEDINVVYLGMGPAAFSISSDENKNIYADQAKDSEEILSKITQICTRVFNSNRLEANSSTGSVSFDIPMKQLIVFAQGEGVKISGITTPAGEVVKPTGEPVEVIYSPSDATTDSYKNNAPDTSLEGEIAVFDTPLDAGSYTIDVSNAKTLEVYYKPDIEVTAVLYNQYGDEVTDLSSLEAGDYEIEFGFVKTGTQERVPESSLLGDVSYEAIITNNGKELDAKVGNHDTIHLEEGDLKIDVIARYLSYNSVSTTLDYRIFTNKDLQFSLKNDPVFTVDSKGFITDEPVEIEVSVNGQTPTAEQWAQMRTPEVTLSQSASAPALEGVEITKSDTPGLYTLTPILPASGPGEELYQPVSYTLSYSEKVGDETWSGRQAALLRLGDERSWFERYTKKILTLFFSLLGLILLLGYVPGIKPYLPKTLAKRPRIRCDSMDYSEEGDKNRKGNLKKITKTTLIPYMPEEAYVSVVPSGSKVRTKPLKLRARRDKRMTLVNTRDYAGKNNFSINGQKITKDSKPVTLASSAQIVSKSDTWKYTCTLNQSASGKTASSSRRRKAGKGGNRRRRT